MWIGKVLLVAIITIVILYVINLFYTYSYEVPVEKAIEVKKEKSCIPTTMKGYFDLPEDISAQRVDKLYNGAKEADVWQAKPVPSYVYNASYLMATGYSEAPPKYVWSSPMECTSDALACSDQNRQCMTDLSQLDNVDDNLMYQRVTNEQTVHKPGYTKAKPSASYI